MNLRALSVAVAAIACVAVAPMAAHAQQGWAQHPAYLHAMSNLRTAYWLESHHEATDPAQSIEENKALEAISAAYKDLKDAAVVDDKDIADQPPANFTFGDHGGRLHRALDLLNDAHDQLAKEEDNPAAHGLRDRALHHIDSATRHTSDAIQNWHF